MTVQSYQTAVFQLGEIAFTVLNCDGKYVEDLHHLFPTKLIADVPSSNVINVQSECNKDILTLVNYVASRHRECVAFCGTVLVSPQEKKILLVGPPGVGRTTLAMEAVYKHGWKIFTDELVLLNYTQAQFIPFTAPFRYDDKTANLLGENSPSDFIRSTWIGAKPLYSGIMSRAVVEKFPPQFDYVFWLDAPGDVPGQSQSQLIQPGAVLTKILPLSNLLRAKNASEIIFLSLQSACCRLVSCGLDGRMQLILNETL